MKTIMIEGVNKPISPITLGCDGKGFQKGEDLSSFLDEVYQVGITSFDTARGYGHSEEVLGKWMKERSNREKVVIISKCCLPAGYINRVKVKNIRKDLEKSLKALQTDYVDILYLHRDSHKVSPIDLLIEMNKMIEEGKVRAIGVSNWSAKRIKEANDYALSHGLVPFRVSSPAYSLASMEKDPWKGSDGCISIQDRQEELSFYKDKQVALFPYSSLARGFFAGKYPSSDPDFASHLDRASRISYYSERNLGRLKRAEELAKQKGTTPAAINIAYLHSQGYVISCVISSSKPKRMKDNLEATELVLTESEIAYLEGR